MRVLYEFLKFLLKIAVPFFYSKTKILNRERLKFKGPAILISNHPNTLMDPFNVALYMRRQVNFLANASMFNTAFTNWLFSNLYCVPIQRSTDKGAEHVKNEESFDRCDQFLAGGGVLWIAPEGGSVMARNVRPFKTGTARIGFSAENRKAFELNLPIIPVGISYSNPEKFRSAVVVNVGEYIYPKDFQTSYKQDSRQAVRELTQTLEKKVRSLAIHIEEEDKEFIEQIEILLNSEQPLDQKTTFFRTLKAIEQIDAFKEKDNSNWEKLKEATNTYFSQLKENRLSDKYLLNPEKGLPVLWITILAGFPLALFGWLNNIIPAFLPAFLARKMNLYPGYNATIKILSGMFIFPLWYYLMFKLVSFFSGGYYAWFYLGGMLLYGLFYLWYSKRLKSFLQKKRNRNFKHKKKTLFEKLLEERKQIWEEFSKVLTLK